jgi:hypothetical protein
MRNLLSWAPSAAGAAMHDLKWSGAEKVIARKAFDVALDRELQAVILEAKCKAAKIQQPSDLWAWNSALRNAGRKSIAYTTTATQSCRSFLRIFSATAAW